MIKGWQFWLLNGLALLAIGLSGVNVWLGNENREQQTLANDNQQYINQTTQLTKVGNQLVRSLATVATQTNDDEIRALLADSNIAIRNAPGPQGGVRP